MCQSENLFWKTAVRILVVFPPIFVAGTKTIYGYNLVAPSINRDVISIWKNVITAAIN